MKRVSRHCRAIGIALLVFHAAEPACAEFAVTPNSHELIKGREQLRTVFATTGRTYQMQISAKQLEGIPPGSLIDGLSFRYGWGAESSRTATFAHWHLTLAQASNSIGKMSTAFAENMANPQLVRSGALQVSASDYPRIGVNAWGPIIRFDSSYLYRGGDLVVLISHTGVPVEARPEGVFGAQWYGMDASSGGAPADGTPPPRFHGPEHGELRAMLAFDYNSPTGVEEQRFTVTRFSFTPVPECSSLALGCLSTLVLVPIGRRRRGRLYSSEF
jgi:hypothetical protein